MSDADRSTAVDSRGPTPNDDENEDAKLLSAVGQSTMDVVGGSAAAMSGFDGFGSGSNGNGDVELEDCTRPPDLSMLPTAGQLFPGSGSGSSDLESGAGSLPQRLAAESAKRFKKLRKESFITILFGCVAGTLF